MPRIQRARLVKVVKGRKPNSPWKITLTRFGRDTYMRHIGGKIQDAFQLVTGLSEQKTRQVLRKVMAKVFSSLLTKKGKIDDFQKLDTFLKAMEEPYMDLANRPLKGIRRSNSMQPYYQARFTIDRAPWHMIRHDALLALEMKHWVSPTRISLLATLGIRTEHSLAQHNRKWDTRIEGKDPLQEKEKECKAREAVMKALYPAAFARQQTWWDQLKYF